MPPPLSDGADAFDREMASPICLPDLARLQAHHDAHGATLAAGLRWNRGHDIGAAASALPPRIDLPARWDACARAALARQPIAAPPPAL